MTADPVVFPDDFGDDDDVPTDDGRQHFDPRLADPDDPNSDYLPGDWWEKRSQGNGTPTRPLIAGRCERIKKDGSRCRQWQVHGLRYCVVHSGVKNLPNVKEYHEQVVHNARLALMKMVPSALTAIEELIEDDETPPAVRLRASTEVMDRTGIRGGTELDITVEHMEDPGDTLTARLEQLRSRAAAAAEAQTKALEARTIPGTVVQDDGQLDLFADADDEDGA